MALASLQIDGRIGEAELFAAQPLWLAIGRGLPAWDTAPEPATTSLSALIDEIGRIKITQVQFVEPDAAGEIEIEGASGIERYRVSATPTAYLHTRFSMGYTDAQNETIREIALYFGCTPKATVPVGQRWITPAEIDSNGRMKLYERRSGDQPPSPKIVRVAGDRPVFEYVLPF